MKLVLIFILIGTTGCSALGLGRGLEAAETGAAVGGALTGEGLAGGLLGMVGSLAGSMNDRLTKVEQARLEEGVPLGRNLNWKEWLVVLGLLGGTGGTTAHLVNVARNRKYLGKPT